MKLSVVLQKQQREKGTRRLEDDNGPSSSQLEPHVNEMAAHCHIQEDKNSSQIADSAVPSDSVELTSQDENSLSIFNGKVEELPMKPFCEEVKGDCQAGSLSLTELPLDENQHLVCTAKSCFSEKVN
ncbi:unnamed protein product [Cylicostephanus goldi]|uniref:Uncharacterized protein n=1 Tax=Cylicostephanus goldi TaxID=71465 RepID=A0A3P7Q447_CYLGO|nr:unnamed protein product [Cylicostephanus goldi]